MADTLVDAVVSYIRASMALELGDTSATPKAFNTYAAAVSYPYAVIFNPQEAYDFQSGTPPTYIADGLMLITFYSESGTEALRLAQACVLHFLAEEDAGDGAMMIMGVPILEFRPSQAASIGLTDEGTGQPTVFARTVTFHYRQQFPTV